MNRMMRSVLIAATVAVGLGFPCMVWGAGTAGLPTWEGYAAEYPDYHAKWGTALEQGTNALLALLEGPSPRVKDRERMTTYDLSDLYLQAGLSPWIAFIGKGGAVTPVVAGGKVWFTIRTTFSTVMRDRERSASIMDFVLRPPMPYLFAEESKGWMPGRTKQGSPAINGWIDQPVWVKVPTDVDAGRLAFTAYALTYGSQDGALEKKQQKQAYTLRVVSAPEPTRAHALCVWAYGIEQGQSLANAGASPRQRDVLLRQLRWMDELLVTFGETEALAELVQNLRRHPQYESKVLSRLEDSEEGE